MRLKRLLQLLAAIVVFGGVAGALSLYWAISYFGKDLPDHRELASYQPSNATRIHAGDGRLIGEFATERRIFVPIQAMPKRVIHAVIATEDQNFYSHSGVDWMATLRAMVGNLEKYTEDKRPVGASGITQQVTRHFFLTNEVSYTRKIREAILAYRLEDALSKDRILELYLNENFLGNRAYGVAAAAQNYFDKSLDELTVAEAAFLASLFKAPDRYYRERFRDAALARRNYVIDRMREDGYITAEEQAQAKVEPLQFHERGKDEFFAGADYYVEEVRRELAQVYGDKALYEGGLSVRTSLSPKLQEIATKALRDGLIAYDRRDGWRGPAAHLDNLDGWKEQLAKVPTPPGGEIWQLAAVLKVTDVAATIGLKDGSEGAIALSSLRWARRFKEGDGSGPPVKKVADVVVPGDIVLVEKFTGKEPPEGVPAEKAFELRQVPAVQGALIAMDPHTGRVLAMQGGFSAKMSVFNRVTQANRQPGSSFKPFVYLAAMEKGLTPSTLVLDAPFTLTTEGQGKWRPGNYQDHYLGPTPLRVGVEKSKNLMTVRLAQNIGMSQVVDVARRFGIYDDLPPVLSMALGAGETTLMRLATGYAMLVNGGRKVTPTIIDRVQDRQGKTIYRHDARPCEGCLLTGQANAGGAPPAVPQVPDNREQVGDPRTIYQIVAMLEGVVQRGTAVRLRELNRPIAGKTGTTNDSDDVWFMGFSPDLVCGVFVGFDTPRSLGDKETGASIAVPIFKDFMAEALAGQPPTPFRVPPGLRLVKVDSETGRLADPADRHAIWEPFIPGTEPDGEQGVLDGGDGGSFWISNAEAAGKAGTGNAAAPTPVSVGSGTGGVY